MHPSLSGVIMRTFGIIHLPRKRGYRMISFGTGGWRAIIGDDFTKENVRKLMFALAQRMKREDVADKSFCIGYDRRFLSREAAEWAAEVMAGEGIHVLMINREAPTPLIMFTVQYYGLDYGIAVTASHNPALYNGIKLFTKGGRDAVESVTNELGAAANDVDPKEIHSIEYKRAIAAGLVQEINPQNQYLDAIIRGVNMDAIRSRNLQIVLDPMYGVSRTSLQTILLTARCDVSVIHERHDTLFGGRLPAPNVDTLGALQAAVLQEAEAQEQELLFLTEVVPDVLSLKISQSGDADLWKIIEVGQDMDVNVLCRDLCGAFALEDMADYLLSVPDRNGFPLEYSANGSKRSLNKANGKMLQELPLSVGTTLLLYPTHSRAAYLRLEILEKGKGNPYLMYPRVTEQSPKMLELEKMDELF